MDDAKDSVFEESSPVHSPFSPGHQGFGVPGLEFFSPRFQELLEDGAEAQRFLNFLSEFNADADAMFILQVDQIRELVDSPSKSTSNVFFDNVDRLYHKHISEDSKLPLTLISNRSLELLRRIMEEKTVTMNDLVVVQQKIKAKLDRDFVPKFLERKKDQPLVSALDVGNRNPSIQQVLHDVECMQLFILFLMKDMRHRMFLFWFELQQISSIHGTEGKESDIVRNEEFRKMASIYRKYVSKGDVSDTIGEIKYDHISSNLADTDTFELFKIKKLTATLSRMHKKVGKLLRLECWPQFCESELFKDLVKQRDENQKGALKSVSKSSSIHRMSLPSLFKKHVFSEDVVITSPKLDDFRRKLDIALKHAPELRYLEYVAVVRSAHVLPKKSSKVQETDFVREIVRQYPEKSRDDVPFPQHLPLFCFPEKHNIVTSRFKHVPAPPRLFNFIFSADQITFYGACLQISEIETGDSRFDSKSIDKRKREVGAMYAVVLLTRAPLVNTLRTILTDFSQCYNGGPIFECESFHKITSLLTTNWRPSKEMMNVYNLCSYKVSLDPQLLPSVDFELSALFKIMHPYKILSVLEYLVLEKKVLLVSSQLSILTIVGETLRLLLQPFSFQFLYTPILPRALLSALQCPTPFLIGIHSSMKEDALQLDHISQDLFVVDLDFDSVSPSFVVESPFPPLVRTKLLRYFRRTCFDNLIDIDYAHVNILEPSESSSGELIASLRNQLSRVWMEDILLDLSNFLIFIPQTKEDKAPLILFDAPAFFRGKSDSYLPFLKAFFRTSAFSAYLATLVAQKDVRELCILGDVDK